MSRAIFNTVVLTACCLFAVVTVAAQQMAQTRQVLSQIKIESFDWYAASEVAEPPVIKYGYRRGFPEGERANFPAGSSSRQKTSEKFVYRIRIRNLTEREITSIAWRYEFFNPFTGELAVSLEFVSRARQAEKAKNDLRRVPFAAGANGRCEFASFKQKTAV